MFEKIKSLLPPTRRLFVKKTNKLAKQNDELRLLFIEKLVKQNASLRRLEKKHQAFSTMLRDNTTLIKDTLIEQNTFIDTLRVQIDNLSQQSKAIQAEQRAAIDELSKQITQISKNIQTEQAALDNKLVLQLNTIKSDLGQQTAHVTENIRVEQSRAIDLLEGSKIDLTSMITENKRLIHENMMRADEVIWAETFHDTIKNSEWLKWKTFSPGRWAAGYAMLYLLYRVLNEFQPKRILELGLGQSTVMITQYASYFGVLHNVVEHDPEWIESFSKAAFVGKKTNIDLLDIYQRSYLEEENEAIYSYKDCEKFVGRKKFDLVVIDGPFGYGSNKYARIDLIDCLPRCLKPSFAIIVDDTNRSGETATCELMKKLLNNNGIDVCIGQYRGAKYSSIIASSDLKFLCSL